MLILYTVQTVIAFVANYLYLASIALGLYGLFLAPKEIQTSLIKTAFFSLPIAFIVGKIANYFIENPRPFVVQKNFPLIPHAPDNGFPSDHTLLVATIAATIFVYKPKLGMILFLLAFLIGGSRVLARIHHPADILGSIGIAILAVIVAKTLAGQIKFTL